MRVLILFLLLTPCFAQALPDAPVPQPKSSPFVHVRPQKLYSTGRKIENLTIPIPHTRFSIQPDYDDFGNDPFHHSPTFRPLWHVKGTRSLWFTIRF
jgi:hypothetical protein